MECQILRDEMMEVLYGEADAETARRVEEHHGVCAECRDEMAALRAVRADLAKWTVPPRRRIHLRLPYLGWGRYVAAAAALIVAAGAALGLSGSELSYREGRVAFRLGRADAQWRELLTEHEARHQEEIRKLQTALDTSAPRDSALLARVQDLIKESEARQAVLMSASLAEQGERSEAQRRYDLARVSAGFSYLDGRTGDQVARTNELMGYVLKVSQQK